MDFLILEGSNFFLYINTTTRTKEFAARKGKAHIPVSNGFIPIEFSNSPKDLITKAGKITDVKLISATTKVAKNTAQVTKDVSAVPNSSLLANLLNFILKI